MWVRGLKQVSRTAQSVAALSHPMWVRGLKLDNQRCHNCHNCVASYVGAWIETSAHPSALQH